jgi:hypothetical protein
LEEALRHWCDQEAVARCLEYARFSWRLPIIVPDSPPTPYEIGHDEWWRRRKPLEEEFMRKLRRGELIATALDIPLRADSRRQEISPELWRVLEPDFDENSAAGGGLKIIEIEIAEPKPIPNENASPPLADPINPDRQGNAGPQQVEFEHAADYDWVRIRGQSFTLSPLQAAVVRRLHAANQRGIAWVRTKLVLTEAGSKSFKLSDVFKARRGPSWDELIESDGRGRCRLNLHDG